MYYSLFQGSVLDGHALILQRCHGKKDEQTLKKVQKDHSSTKLIVRNVAFEVTEKELRQLFSPFGQVIIILNYFFANLLITKLFSTPFLILVKVLISRVNERN